MRTLADHTANDVTAEDQAQYAAHVERWQNDLHPNGALECYFAAEIARAAWRMERYSPLGPQANSSPASSSDQACAAWLRYRDQTNLGLRRNLEELRRLQSDRYLQAHLGHHLPGIASLKTILASLKVPQKQAKAEATSHQPKVDPPTVVDCEATLHARLQEEERCELNEYFKNNPDEVPKQASPPAPRPIRPAAGRNQLCPCNSGRKYKHCCGHWSKTNLKDAT